MTLLIYTFWLVGWTHCVNLAEVAENAVFRAYSNVCKGFAVVGDNIEEHMEIKNSIGVCLLGFVLLTTGCRGGHPDTKNPEPKGAALKGNPIVTGTIIHKVQPVYPPAARAAGMEGTVTLHAIIAADGSVESLDAIDGPVMLRGAASRELC